MPLPKCKPQRRLSFAQERRHKYRSILTMIYKSAFEGRKILGGNSCIRGGKGERIERLYREVRINAIGGGSEEISLPKKTQIELIDKGKVLLDLAVRQALRTHSKL